MALNIDNEPNSRRPLGFGLIGAVLIIFSGYLFYELEQQKSGDVYVPSSYEYTIRQSVDTNVVYLDSSYFENNRPGDNNTAYVKDLTKRITAKFNYNFSANDTADLSYSYNVKAKILGKYAIKADSDNTANVWSKEYTIVKPVSESLQTKNLTLNPTADLPFQEYMSQLENFKSNLELPLNSETLLVATVDVEGTIKGTPFHDTRVMTVSAPLDQQVYTLGIKYDKQDTKKLVGETAKNSREQFQRYLLIFASAVGVLGIGMLLYGLRKQIFKTPYQRELERIYRYNDGIIIRAQRSPDLTGKRIVPVLSFEDMLNLEEELKMPIVASPAGGEATRFIIIRDDVAYVFTLGKALIEEDSLETIEDEIDDKKSHKRKTKQ
jgi:hypothetical protein